MVDVRLSLPQTPAPDGAVPLPSDDSLGVELLSVVASARRRAARDGDRRVDTAHLLHSLLEADPVTRALCGDGTRQTRLLGYLAQRSIGYGLRWRTSAGRADPCPVTPGGARAVRWSPAAAAALERAALRARRRGAECASGPDLLAELVADRECRAVEVLARVGIDPVGLG
ncbi:Clp protease N-terminal domain-containing protein [Streptomyces sp. JNUCC 64]